MQLFSLSSKVPLVVVVVALMTGPFSAHCSSQLKVTILDRLPLDNRLFTQNMILEDSARSLIDCSKKCVETEGCAMCTFHPSPEGPSPGLCRLHSRLQKDTDDKQSRPGARSMAPRPPSCNSGGYVLECGTCVKIVMAREVYSTAREKCHQEGGHLARAQTAAKSDCLWNLRRAQGAGRLWLGADNMRTSKEFQWNDGVWLPKNSSLWRRGQPNASSNNNICVYFNPRGKGLWDMDFTAMMEYICEKPRM